MQEKQRGNGDKRKKNPPLNIVENMFSLGITISDSVGDRRKIKLVEVIRIFSPIVLSLCCG